MSPTDCEHVLRQIELYLDGELVGQIRLEVERAGGEARMSTRPHESGTDRIAEVVQGIEADLVVNVQGDEPFTRREPLGLLLEAFEGPEGAGVGVATFVPAPPLLRSMSDWTASRRSSSANASTAATASVAAIAADALSPRPSAASASPDFSVT